MPGPVVFDAYGTLFDVYAVTAQLEEFFPGEGARLAEYWRVAQIDYTRLRTLGDQYIDFADITVDALDFALEKAGVRANGTQRVALLDSYQRLTAFEENLDVLSTLKDEGFPLAILSNGTPAMLESAIKAADMGGIFDHVLSVDAVKFYKITAPAYQLAVDAFDTPAEEITFVSSNGWDVCGAAWFGFTTFWVNRAGNPLDKLGVKPDGEGRTLNDLLAFLTA